MNKAKVIRWTLACLSAIILTGMAMVYQSKYGPTKPRRAELWLNDDQAYKFKLPRSHGGATNCLVEVTVPDITVTGNIYYRRFPTQDKWEQINMVRVSDQLAAFLPHQPPAGKLEYYIEFQQDGKVFRVPSAEQVVIRFRGDVPAWIILPHALLMFIAMFLSNLTLFLVLLNIKQYRLFGIITTSALLAGGLILGPMVQKYAFGEFWTGFPRGLDLTDNKTLIAFIFWALAVLFNLKKERKFYTILASLVMLVIFTIPHSAKGSELDPSTGKIKTGEYHLNRPVESHYIWSKS
jgi:hypothetical protein